MQGVLAIDGANTGAWALWRPGMIKPRANTFHMPKTTDMVEFLGSMLRWMQDFRLLEPFDRIVIEAPFVKQHKSGTECPHCGRFDYEINGKEVDKLFGIVHSVELAASVLEVKCRRAARATVVKHISGVGRGSRKQFKQYCLLGCQRRGWNVSSEDIADACATLDWYCFDERIKVPWNNNPAPGPIFDVAPGVRIDADNRAAANRIIRSALSFDTKKEAAE